MTGLATSTSRPFKTIQPATPAKSAPAVKNADGIVWKKAETAVVCVNSAMMDFNSARPVSGLNSYPTGCCMKAFAAKMK